MVMYVPFDQDVEKISLFAGSCMCLQSRLFHVYLGPMVMYMPAIILSSFHHGVWACLAMGASQPSMTLSEAHVYMPAQMSYVCQKAMRISQMTARHVANFIAGVWHSESKQDCVVGQHRGCMLLWPPCAHTVDSPLVG